LESSYITWDKGGKGRRGSCCGFLLLLTLAFPVRSQHIDGNLTALIKAEHDFAQTAFETSIRNAFLANLDSNGVLFDHGKPINGIAAYTPVPDRRTDLLSWYPIVAHVSSSGDLGFTSGPYQFFAERGKEPVGSGYFFSIWKKNAAGHFKLMLDGGVAASKNHADAFKSNPRPDSTAYDFLRMNPSPKTKDAGPWEAELAFVATAASDPQEAYKQYLAEHSLMLRNDQHAGLSKPVNLSIIAREQNVVYQFKKTGQGISQNGDLAYCYGEATLTTGQEARRGFFVRVWHFQQDAWKIVTEEISLV
jgi:ketosteroid isomerase-like protein